MLGGARRPTTAIDANGMSVAPNNNTVGGFNLYSTTACDVVCQEDNGTPIEAVNCGLIFFDAAISSPSILAAAFYTLSGTTVTLAAQSNVSSVGRNNAGSYQINFTSNLADADYSMFCGGRAPNSASVVAPIVGQNATSGPNNKHTISAFSEVDIPSGGSSPVELLNGAAWAINASSPPTGVLAAVRFSVSGAACTIIKSTNVSSVTYIGLGTYRVNFASALANANYGVLAQGLRAPIGADFLCLVAPCFYSVTDASYSTTALAVSANAPNGIGVLDVVNCDVMIFDPALIGGGGAATKKGQLLLGGL